MCKKYVGKIVFYRIKLKNPARSGGIFILISNSHAYMNLISLISLATSSNDFSIFSTVVLDGFLLPVT